MLSSKRMVNKMNKSWNIMSTNDPIPAPGPVNKPVQNLAFAHYTETTEASRQLKEKGRDNSNGIPGYIFLCNVKTKPQCFQYSVFGLPLGQMKTVERIKPGSKLFLFDYEMRLLYGVYEAAAEGKINLEPAAFKGKFPAQVKFRVVKDCLPLSEKSFSSAIKDNYYGTRFRSELSEPQVKALVSLFRTFSSSSSEPVALPLPNAAPPRVMLPLGMEDQYKHSIRLHSQGMVEPQPIQTVQIMQQQKHTAGALVDHVHPSFQHQSFPNPIYSQDQYSTIGHTQVVQEPYSRYCSEGVPQYHTLGLGGDYHPFSLWSKHPQQENDIWYNQQLPLFRERENTLNGKGVGTYASVPTTCSILSTLQPHVPAYERPELTYPVPSAFISPTVQPHASASGRPVQTYLLPADQYFSPTMQPCAPASRRPEPSYAFPAAPYVSSTMQPCTPASGSPEENYSLPIASHALSTMQPYAPASGRPEPNYPLPTASYVSSTMQPHEPSFGRSEPYVSTSSYFTFVGENQVIN